MALNQSIYLFPAYSWNLVSTARGNLAPMEKDLNPKYLPGNHFKAEKPLPLSFVKRTKSQPHATFSFWFYHFYFQLIPCKFYFLPKQDSSTSGEPENRAGTGRSPDHPRASCPFPTGPLWKGRATLNPPPLAQETKFPFDVSPVHVLLLF